MYVLQLVCVTFVRESIARKKVSISEGVAGANYFFTNIQHILLMALHVYRVQYAFQPTHAKDVNTTAYSTRLCRAVKTLAYNWATRSTEGGLFRRKNHI